MLCSSIKAEIRVLLEKKKKKPCHGRYGPLSINFQSFSGILSELRIEQDASFSYFPSRAAKSLRGHPSCYFTSSPVSQQGGQAVSPSQPRDVWQQACPLSLLLTLCSGVPNYSHPLMTTAGRQEDEEHTVGSCGGLTAIPDASSQQPGIYTSPSPLWHHPAQLFFGIEAVRSLFLCLPEISHCYHS